MTDIFIKSFNRPFYLDRCLWSINQNITGPFRVTVLDDGTPKKYLEKIEQKYPEVRIIRSEHYEEKIKAIEENLNQGKEIDGFKIPVKLWFDAVKNGSEYCIVTEDDVWFTAKLNLDQLVSESKKFKIKLLKLGWLGNFKDDQNIMLSSISDSIDRAKPKKLFLPSPFLMDVFFYNKFKFFSLGYRLKFFDNSTKRKYWTLNSILMGFWQKDYWLSIWKDSEGRVDEKQQLRNAANFYRKNQDEPNVISRLKNEAMKTTFQSSATNSYHKYGFNFDVNYFNHLINEAWYNDKFDTMQNFPNDFTMGYFEGFLDEKIDRLEFQNWVERFKNQYKNLGCNVE